MRLKMSFSPHPKVLLSELHTSFSRNDGNLLEALHPGLLSAVADVVEATPKDAQAQNEPDVSKRPVEAHAPPITWEEVRQTFLVEGTLMLLLFEEKWKMMWT